MGVICSGGHLLDLWCGEIGHSFDLHVAVLELVLVVMFEQHGADEARDAALVGEEPTMSARRFTYLLSRPKELVERGASVNLNSRDEWIADLTTAMLAASKRKESK